MKTIPRISAVSLAVGAVLAGGVVVQGWVGTSPQNLELSLTINGTCTLSGGGTIAFGNVTFGVTTGIQTAPTKVLTVACGTGATPSTLTFNDGSNPSGGSRYLSDGTNTIAYNLHKMGGVTPWDGNATVAVGAHDVIAKTDALLATQPIGTYTDTVVATLTYL